jgi:hypothetical protein
MTAPNPCLDAALRYADLGWPVIPLHAPRFIGGTLAGCTCGNRDCGSIGKHPCNQHGLHEPSTDPDVIREWWRRWPFANVGIVTGARTGWIVLDIDPRHGGNESLGLLMDEKGLPETAEADTGGGGLHLLFAHPGGKVRNSKAAIAPGVDVKGDGGYIVAAPSMHASGNRYRWKQGETESAKPAGMPDWLREAVTVRDKPPQPERRSSDDASDFWLRRALEKAAYGNRNDTGWWLACQWRDNGVSQSEAERLAASYARSVPQGDQPYSEREMLATVRSAYRGGRREPAKNQNPAASPAKTRDPVPTEAPAGAAKELRDHLHDFASGRLYCAPFSHPMLTDLTQALLAPSVTSICGEPGIGKTFFVLQELRHWFANGIDADAFFIEKDRKFHLLRLIAQLECNPAFVDARQMKDQQAMVDAAMVRHGELIDELGRHIHSGYASQLTLADMGDWCESMFAKDKRVLVIDPITLLDAGRDRWIEDQKFMVRAQQLVTKYEASLILITHPKQGPNAHKPTASGQAGGAAYHRAADTQIWLHKPAKPRRVFYRGPSGMAQATFSIFGLLQKTRLGRGAGLELAFDFRNLLFKEQGVVMKDSPNGEEGEAA